MDLPSYFDDFLTAISLKPHHRAALITGHATLRRRLHDDEELRPIIVSDFLQGSYRRATALGPKGERRADVDVVVVTRLDRGEYTPQEAMDQFVPFMERHYPGKYRLQGRSIGIELSYVDLDLVITSAPSMCDTEALRSKSVRSDDTIEEARDWRVVRSWIDRAERSRRSDALTLLRKAAQEEPWRTEPLWIPDREVSTWERTHPLAQITWTAEKNARCGYYYVRAVRALKWWWREQYPEAKYPKGYPLEHLIGQSCPDGVTSIAEGVTLTLEDIASRYALDALMGQVPVLSDHGVPEHNVLHRLSAQDFAYFHEQVCTAAPLARQAFAATDRQESARLWHDLFDDPFPYNEDDGGDNDTRTKGGFTARTAPTHITGGRFA